MQKEHILSFCINLEVLNFQGRNPSFIFWENLRRLNLFLRFSDLYTITAKIYGMYHLFGKYIQLNVMAYLYRIRRPFLATPIPKDQGVILKVYFSRNSVTSTKGKGAISTRVWKVSNKVIQRRRTVQKSGRGSSKGGGA